MKQNKKGDAECIAFSFAEKGGGFGRPEGPVVFYQRTDGMDGKESVFLPIEKFPTGNPMGKEKQN